MDKQLLEMRQQYLKTFFELPPVDSELIPLIEELNYEVYLGREDINGVWYWDFDPHEFYHITGNTQFTTYSKCLLGLYVYLSKDMTWIGKEWRKQNET